MYNLLLADDEPIIRRGIKSMTTLSGMGIDRVFEAENALSALDIVHAEQVDIAFLDINMPDMDGLTLAARLREIRPEIRIVMITGYDYFEYMQTAIRTGVDDYLLKPVSRADIEQVLRRVIVRLQSIHIDRQLRKLDTEETPEPKDEWSSISDYVREHIFDTDFSLSKAAEALGFNSSYLSGVFKRQYGIPFQEYVGQKRMERAKLLLLSQNMKNAEIARAVGYEDVNYFITKFSRTFHMSPRQFRQGVLNNEI